MILMSFLGSPEFLVPVTFVFYLLSTNRIKVIALLLYTSVLVYIIAILKNVYHTSRPFMQYSEIDAM